MLLIGSGPIVIGQACEFDYSGTQALKVLKEQGLRVVLINSNPATIMTDPEFADATYIEPITEDSIFAIIKKESVDAILPTMGGQTALNVCLKMHEKNMLGNVRILGANIEAIKKGEDRKLFKECMQKIGCDVAKSFYAYSLDEALDVLNHIAFPLIIRASFTLGGGGSGVAYNIEEYRELVTSGINASPIGEILIEESLLGWKEYEMEVIRDRADNCIIVCSIENLDPMGVHTGDSITIAPALTLTDKEFQRMRDASFKILREIGVDTGGSNVQFAINPDNGRMVVIEMNPRVSRSSALASKATGYPIAKVATLLALGFRLDEITNDITKTTAAFEPSIDYIVTKIPRFAFEKFKEADSTLTTSMKSIGEVMAIGSNFYQSFQKALCSLELGICGLDRIDKLNLEQVKSEILRPNATRFLAIAQAFANGLSIEQVHDLCKIDRFFLHKIKDLVDFEKKITKDILQNKELLIEAKQMGFSDAFISKHIGQREEAVRKARSDLGIKAQFEFVDTCAGEFDAKTSYLYSSFAPVYFDENKDKKDANKKVLILGSGPNRIGQGIEFDYACVHAAFALKDMGIKSIMYNCNPETVSTDYDTSDVLYFEPIDFEHVLNVLERENVHGIIVHFGGQTPLKLAQKIKQAGFNILGTSADVIDRAEDRDRFNNFVKENDLNAPKGGIAFSIDEAKVVALNIGYPVLVRPSYVLGGRAMRIVQNEAELLNYMNDAIEVSGDSPILIDRFLEGAIELDVDCICDGRDVFIGAILQHIEEAGIHSGDSSSIMPPIGLNQKILEEIALTSAKIARKLGVIGLMNVQFAIYQNRPYILEVNPRASRTVPFVSKACGIPLAKVATQVMLDVPLANALNFYSKFGSFVKVYELSIDGTICNIYEPRAKNGQKHSHIALKASVFPFDKMSGSDLLLGPEMKSTGEVMGISHDFGMSFAKSQIMSKNALPLSGRVFLSLSERDKTHAGEIALDLQRLGFEIVATEGTHNILSKEGIESTKILKIHQGRPNIQDALKNGEISLAINTSENNPSKIDAKIIRVQVLKSGVPYLSTITGAKAAIEAIKSLRNIKNIGSGLFVNEDSIPEVKSLQEFLLD